jgi:hypothetical protein
MIKPISEIRKIEKYKNIFRQEKPITYSCSDCVWKKEIQKIDEQKHKKLRHIIITAFCKIECWSVDRGRYVKRDLPLIQDVDYFCRFFKKEIK